MENKEDPEQCRMIFSTYPTIMNAIDDTKRKDGNKLFTPGHFDMIILDEAHRSVYNKYQDIFNYFDAMILGLTATPRDEVDKNTYDVFDEPVVGNAKNPAIIDAFDCRYLGEVLRLPKNREYNSDFPMFHYPKLALY